MIETKVDISGALKGLAEIPKKTEQANNAAVQAAAKYAMSVVRTRLQFGGLKAPTGYLGSRTGRLVSQLKVKTFRQRNGLRGAAVEIIGDREYIMHINEFGAKSHGRPRGGHVGNSRAERRAHAAKLGTSALPARRVFALTWKAVETQLAAKYIDSFNANFKDVT